VSIVVIKDNVEQMSLNSDVYEYTVYIPDNGPTVI